MKRSMWKKLFRDLRTSLAQVIALIVIVAIGVANLIALSGAYLDLGTSYNHTYDQLKFADVTFRVQGMPEDEVAKVQELSGVEAVTGRLVIDSGYELPDGIPVRSRVIGIPRAGQPAVNQLYIAEGNYFTGTADNIVIVESHFAAEYDLHPGDIATPILMGKKMSLTIEGIASSPEYLVVSPSRQDLLPSAKTFSVLFVPLDALQQWAGMPEMVNDIAVVLTKDADEDKVIAEISEVLAPYGVQATTLREDQPSNAALKLDLDSFREMAGSIPLLILFVAALSLYVMLGRLVRAQRSQIGLMKALGYSNRQIMAYYIYYALVVSVIGTVVGALLGVFLSQQITSIYAEELGIPLVQTRIYPDLIAEGALVSILLAVLAAVGPARASTRLTPAQAMRVDPAEALAHGRRTIIERMVTMSLTVRLPLRNVFRVRRRTLSTWISIVFAFVLLLFGFGMIDSMDYLLEQNFHTVEKWDMMMVFSAPQTEGVLNDVDAKDGVAKVEPALIVPATLKVNGEQEDVMLTALRPEQEMHQWKWVDGVDPNEVFNNRGIAITPSMGEKLSIGIGDKVILKTPGGDIEVTVGGFVDELYGATVYMGFDEVMDILSLPQPVFNALYLKTETEPSLEMKKDLFHVPGVASVQRKVDAESEWRSFTGLFYAFMGVVFLFASGMAYAVLFNAMMVNVLERERELATLRTIGTPMRRINLMIYMEDLIIYLMAVIPGLVGGWYTTQAFAQMFSSELFALNAYIYPRSYLYAALSILVVMYLATRPALRRIARLDLAQATKILT